MSQRFVSAKLQRHELSDGDWIELKEPSFSVVRSMSGQDEKEMSFAIIKNVVHAWSFKDEDGQAVEVSDESIDRLTLSTVQEISEIIGAYMKEMNITPSESGEEKKSIKKK